MPRRFTGPPREVMSTIKLPQDLAAQIKLLLLDPTSGQVRWGAWQNLCEKLFREWVEKQKIDPRESEFLANNPQRVMREGQNV